MVPWRKRVLERSQKEDLEDKRALFKEEGDLVREYKAMQIMKILAVG